MTCDLSFTNSAEQDRDQIIEYLINDLASPQAAGHFLDEMEGALGRICEYPELCVLSRDGHLARLGYRPCRYMSYLLLYVYDPNANAVTVGRIFHTRQDYAKLV